MATVFKRNGKGNWIIQWFDHEGVRREKSSRMTDKRAAERLATKLESDVMLRREGIIDPTADRLAEHSSHPLAEHLEEYLDDLRHKGCNPRHVRTVECQLNRMFDDIGAKRLSDLDAVHVQRHLRALRKVPVKQLRAVTSSEGKDVRMLGPRTINAVRAAIIAFLNWNVRTERLATNPCQYIPKVDETRDKRVKRRALTEEELKRLITSSGPRATFYLVAALTGLRMKEMASLAWDDVDLSNDAILVRAHKGKAKRDDWIALSPEVTAALRQIRPAGASPVDHVFETSPTTRTFSVDLKRAGIAEYDELDRRVDRHSLRTTTGTLLARAGVTPQQAQRQMRHADISTTLRHYTDLRLSDQAKAAAKLPSIGSDLTADEADESDEGQHSASGITAEPQHWPQQSLRETAPFDANRCDAVPNGPVESEDSKTRFRTTKREVLRSNANGFVKAGDRDRTDDIQLGKLKINPAFHSAEHNPYGNGGPARRAHAIASSVSTGFLSCSRRYSMQTTYRIEGASRETGVEMDILIDAPSPHDAELLANKQGVLVTRVTESPRSPSQYSVVRLALAFASGIGMLATFLPWISMPMLGSVSGARGDGWISFAGFGIALTASLSPSPRMPINSVRRIVVIIMGIGSVALALDKVLSINRIRIEGAKEDALTAVISQATSVGIGLWTVLLAGAALVVVALVMPENRRTR